MARFPHLPQGNPWQACQARSASCKAHTARGYAARGSQTQILRHSPTGRQGCPFCMRNCWPWRSVCCLMPKCHMWKHFCVLLPLHGRNAPEVALRYASAQGNPLIVFHIPSRLRDCQLRLAQTAGNEAFVRPIPGSHKPPRSATNGTAQKTGVCFWTCRHQMINRAAPSHWHMSQSGIPSTNLDNRPWPAKGKRPHRSHMGRAVHPGSLSR